MAATRNVNAGDMPRRRKQPTPGAGSNKSALTRLEAGVLLVDDVDAALAAHGTAFHVALLERAQGIGDLHGRSSGDAGPVARMSGRRGPY